MTPDLEMHQAIDDIVFLIECNHNKLDPEQKMRFIQILLHELEMLKKETLN